MNDEWRLQIDLRDESKVGALVERLKLRQLEDDLSKTFADRVILSREGARVFAYAETRRQAEAVRRRVARLDEEEESWVATIELRRWHPEAEQWKDAGKSLPGDDAEREAEHEEVLAEERRRSEESGEPEYEVRVELKSRDDAARFAERLEAEGLRPVRRAKYLVVGARDEDEAKELAERLEIAAPLGSEAVAEVSGRVAWSERPPNPFAIFGGLGG